MKMTKWVIREPPEARVIYFGSLTIRLASDGSFEPQTEAAIQVLRSLGLAVRPQSMNTEEEENANLSTV